MINAYKMWDIVSSEVAGDPYAIPDILEVQKTTTIVKFDYEGEQLTGFNLIYVPESDTIFYPETESVITPLESYKLPWDD